MVKLSIIPLSILTFTLTINPFLISSAQSIDNSELNQFCRKFPDNSRCKNSQEAFVEQNQNPQLMNIKVIQLREDWRSDKPDVPWSELVFIESNFDSYYAVFDRNYRKSGGFFGPGREIGFITKWGLEDIDVFLYKKTGCDAILGCSHKDSESVGHSLEVLIGNDVYTLYGDKGNFPISPQLKSALRETNTSTPVSIRINETVVNKIGKKTVEQFSSLYSIEDKLENTTIAETIALKNPLPENSSISTIVSHATPAIVSIKTPRGDGTGFLISENGLILTNRHVVTRTKKPMVTLYDGISIEAEVLKRDSWADVAILKINPSSLKLKALPLCYKKYPSVGEEVAVIGNPLSYSTTVTRGIVSGIRQDENQTLIQTDAPINPGNSGGPILNKHGEVLGVVNQKISGIGIEGIGFAVSIINALKNLEVQLEISEELNVNECGNPIEIEKVDTLS